MDGEFYTTQQAAEALGVTPQRVRELIRENKLEAHRDKETARWLITTRSVHGLEKLPPEPPEARGTRTSAREESRADFWVLVLIAALTLLAAGYTLLTALLGANA